MSVGWWGVGFLLLFGGGEERSHEAFVSRGGALSSILVVFSYPSHKK